MAEDPFKEGICVPVLEGGGNVSRDSCWHGTICQTLGCWRVSLMNLRRNYWKRGRGPSLFIIAVITVLKLMQRLVNSVISSIVLIRGDRDVLLWLLRINYINEVLGPRGQICWTLFFYRACFFLGRNEDGSMEFASLFKLVAPSKERLLVRRWVEKNLDTCAIDTSFDLR